MDGLIEKPACYERNGNQSLEGAAAMFYLRVDDRKKINVFLPDRYTVLIILVYLYFEEGQNTSKSEEYVAGFLVHIAKKKFGPQNWVKSYA